MKLILLTLTLQSMAIFYTGSYTQDGSPAENPIGNGIGCFQLNLETGEIQNLFYIKQRNPSYLTISADKKYLYAVEEMPEKLNPKVYAYKIEEGGTLTLLNSQKIEGDYACHLAIIQDKLVLANYVSGNILSFPIQNNGSLGVCSQNIKHKGTGVDKARQEAAHVHMIYPFGKNSMFGVDLTLDTAKAYKLNNISKQWDTTPNLDIKIDDGNGSRHMVMNNNQDFAYILGELTGEISVADLRGRKSKVVQKISFIPNTHAGAIGGAAIRIHPNGKFLYASNRGSDTIAIFKINREFNTLSLVGHQSTLGKTPRDFNIDKTGKWLIAANQDSNTLIVFKINQNNGMLQETSKLEANTPVNICWL